MNKNDEVVILSHSYNLYEKTGTAFKLSGDFAYVEVGMNVFCLSLESLVNKEIYFSPLYKVLQESEDV